MNLTHSQQFHNDFDYREYFSKTLFFVLFYIKLHGANDIRLLNFVGYVMGLFGYIFVCEHIIISINKVCILYGFVLSLHSKVMYLIVESAQVC